MYIFVESGLFEVALVTVRKINRLSELGRSNLERSWYFSIGISQDLKLVYHYGKGYIFVGKLWVFRTRSLSPV